MINGWLENVGKPFSFDFGDLHVYKPSRATEAKNITR